MTPSSETWPLSLLTLWHQAGVCGQRRALAYRLSLRASPNPFDDKRHPFPADPLLMAMHKLETEYRAGHGRHCRGAIERD